MKEIIDKTDYSNFSNWGGERIQENSPMVSVLVPAYNVEKYLKRALDSVLNQTYKDFEIILIDDGSTDSTPQICDEYGRRYDFVHAYHQKNIGLSKTRERLIEKSTGKYIIWLDSDDYLDPTLLEKAVKAFEKVDVDIVVWGHIGLTVAGETKANQIEELGVKKWRQLVVWGIHPPVWQYASKRELWENIEKFPDDVDLTDDVWLSPQIFLKTEKIVSLGECLYYYDWRNGESITHSTTGKDLCRTALAYYRILKMGLNKYPDIVPPSLHKTRWLLANSYCFNLVHPTMTKYQIDLVKLALRDLNEIFPTSKTKKIYLIQFCVLHGFDFICRLHGKNRIRKFARMK